MTKEELITYLNYCRTCPFDSAAKFNVYRIQDYDFGRYKIED